MTIFVKNVNFWGFCWFFKELFYVKNWVFWQCIQCIRTLHLIYQIQRLENYSYFSSYGGTLLFGGFKTVPDMEKSSKKVSKLKISNPDAKWNNKKGSRSFVITCGVRGTLMVQSVARVHFKKKSKNLVLPYSSPNNFMIP